MAAITKSVFSNQFSIRFGTSLYYSRRLKLLQMYFNLIE